MTDVVRQSHFQNDLPLEWNVQLRAGTPRIRWANEMFRRMKVHADDVQKSTAECLKDRKCVAKVVRRLRDYTLYGGSSGLT